MRLVKNGTRSEWSSFGGAQWLRLRVKTRRLLLVSQSSLAPSESVGAWDTSSNTGSQADRERDPEQQAADCNQRRHRADASGRRMASQLHYKAMRSSFGRQMTFRVAFTSSRYRQRGAGWMIFLSKPIRVAMPAGKAGVLASNDQLSRGGNAPQPVVSDGSRLVWLALAVIPMGWLSAVGVIQHLHRNIISSGRCHLGGLDPDAELVRGKPFPDTLDSFTRWWWKVYVDNFDIGEIFEQEVAAEVIHTESLSQAVKREALNSLGVPRAAEKGASREAVGITKGSVTDGITGRAAPTLRKILDHVSLTAWLLTQPRVCRLWLQAATGRWVFDFQHGRPCFAALDHIWKEIMQFHGWRPISSTCADELLSCICMVPLIYTDMRAHLSSRVFCTDASNFGAGACETIGLTTAGVATSRGEAVRAGSSVSGKIQQKSRPRRWCWGSSGVQITGALMCASICSCPSGLTHGHGPQSVLKSGIGE